MPSTKAPLKAGPFSKKVQPLQSLLIEVKLKAMSRKTVFPTDCFYHIYNRGVDKRNIFLDSKNYAHFVNLLKHYLNYDYPFSLFEQQLNKANNPQERDDILAELETKRVDPPVEIISFCLMPNHYHLTVKQLTEKGITSYLHRLCTSYAMYFNVREDRSGTLFESNFFEIKIHGTNLLVEGKGKGHGVGMCQIGALGMADRGYDYAKILSHYFPGHKFKKIY